MKMPRRFSEENRGKLIAARLKTENFHAFCVKFTQFFIDDEALL